MAPLSLSVMFSPRGSSGLVNLRPGARSVTAHCTATWSKIILGIDARGVMSTEDAQYVHFTLPLDFTSLSVIYE